MRVRPRSVSTLARSFPLRVNSTTRSSSARCSRYHLTPRISLRTDFGLTDPGFARESADSLRQIPLRLDVNYNWERGKWHPFVGAGVGAYFLRFKDNGQAFGETETKPGFNVGAGMEYFTGRTVSLKGEARYHAIGNTRAGTDPSGLVFTGGVKKYW